MEREGKRVIFSISKGFLLQYEYGNQKPKFWGEISPKREVDYFAQRTCFKLFQKVMFVPNSKNNDQQ